MKSLTTLSSSEIAKAVRLAKRKEAILMNIQKIEKELAAIGQSSGATPKQRAGSGRQTKRKPAAKKATTGKRGKLKLRILSALKAAGPQGVSVVDLAAKLKVKPANVYSWFYATGNKLPGIIKISAGRYVLKA